MVTHDDGLSTFLSVRKRLFGIAYRMLGAAAAEDVVQDVWIRWQSTDRCAVRDALAFLTTATTRLAINVKQSACARRETWAAPWTPEPVDTSVKPAASAERSEALTLGISRLLERLSPAERAAYILREAFDYAYRDIADALEVEEANARQLVTRARGHLNGGRATAVRPGDHRRLLAAFTAAADADDAGVLANVFAAELRQLKRGRTGRAPLTSARHTRPFSPVMVQAPGRQPEGRLEQGSAFAQS